MVKSPAVQDSSINVGAFVNRASNLESRPEIDILNSARIIIPKAVQIIENHIVSTNWQKIVLALFNISGMCFGVVRALNLEHLLQKSKNENTDLLFGIDFSKISKGNQINLISHIAYGYGYWGRFALELEDSQLECGLLDLERALDEYSRVTDPNSNLNPMIKRFMSNELNDVIKENLNCLLSRNYGDQDVVNELESSLKIFSDLLSES